MTRNVVLEDFAGFSTDIILASASRKNGYYKKLAVEICISPVDFDATRNIFLVITVNNSCKMPHNPYVGISLEKAIEVYNDTEID